MSISQDQEHLQKLKEILTRVNERALKYNIKLVQDFDSNYDDTAEYPLPKSKLQKKIVPQSENKTKEGAPVINVEEALDSLSDKEGDKNKNNQIITQSQEAVNIEADNKDEVQQGNNNEMKEGKNNEMKEGKNNEMKEGKNNEIKQEDNVKDDPLDSILNGEDPSGASPNNEEQSPELLIDNPTTGYNPLSVSDLIKLSNTILSTVGKIQKIDILPPPTIEYNPLSVSDLIKLSNTILSTVGKIQKIDILPPPTIEYNPLSVSDLIKLSNTILSTIGKIQKIDIPPPPTIEYNPLSVNDLIKLSNTILSTVGKIQKIDILTPITPITPITGYNPISVNDLIKLSNTILSTVEKIQKIDIHTNSPINNPKNSPINNSKNSPINNPKNSPINNSKNSIINTESYQNFITKLITDTSLSMNKYYPDIITISAPQEDIEEEERLIFKDDSTHFQGTQTMEPSPLETAPDIGYELTEKPKETYSASIQKSIDNTYIPKIVLDNPSPNLISKEFSPNKQKTVAKGGAYGSNIEGCSSKDGRKLSLLAQKKPSMKTVVIEADKILKKIMKQIPVNTPKYGMDETSKKRGGANKPIFHDAPVLKKRAYNASNDINQLFKDSNTKLIFKKESPVKYDDDIVDEKVTPENQRKIELSEVKINITEDTENKEDYEKEYELSLENTSPEKLQEMLVNTTMTDESKKALEKILGLAKPQIMCTDPMSCMSYMSDSFAREIFRPTIIIQ